MPLSSLKPASFTPPKDVVVTWNTWRKGLNTLLRENEVDAGEMTQSTNLLLTGSGVPTKRWGSQDFFQASETGKGRFLLPIKDSSDNIQVLAMTTEGYLTKQSGASYLPVAGASWPSLNYVDGTQLGGKVYIVSPLREMVRYDFSTLTNFPTLATPAGVAASNLSAASLLQARGTSTYSWRISAISKSGGETIASAPCSLATLPQDLSQTGVRLQWTPVSAASGDLVAYNIYRGDLGNETWVGGTDGETTFIDPGTPANDPFRTAPTANTTGGLKARYVIRFQDRLVLAGIPGFPTRVVISGRYPQHERFDWYGGGTAIEIEPDSGEAITGLATYQNNSTSAQTIIVFKERSVWEVSLQVKDTGLYAVTVPQYRLLTASQGCSSHRSIRPVENDIMFANRKGVYILRYEPQLQNVINANEISAKIRPFFDAMSNNDLNDCCAFYADKKYILAFPHSKQFVCFDRERLAFTGPWQMPFGVSQLQTYIDSIGRERWIGIDYDDNMVTEFAKTYPDDKGQVIKTIFKSKKEDFGDWTLFKTINEVYLNFKSVIGSVDINIYIEDRTGSTIVAKSFTLRATGSSSTSGIGTDFMGLFPFGETANTPEISQTESQKKAFIYKSSRIFQIEIRTVGRTDNYELLGVKTIAIPQSRGNSPSFWNV